MNEFLHRVGGDHAAPCPTAARSGRTWRRATGGVLAVTVSVGAGVGLGAILLSGAPIAPSAVVPIGTPSSSPVSASGGTHGLGNGSGAYGQPDSPAEVGATPALSQATAAQQVGVVDINTVLAYQGAAAAGTGMVLTSNGEVLTNNHVVNGATSIAVTVVSTGTTYTATVVGTDPSQDVAVLQLQHASALTRVRTSTSMATISQHITGVGNAGGVGGTPSASPGQVTATGRTLTATDQGGANPETLRALIQVEANIQAGDSGGPLYGPSGQVIGMDTAAQVAPTGGTTIGYAIPIAAALKVAALIKSGIAASTVHLGYPAFLGISLSADQPASVTGAVVQQVGANTPAARAGITSGDVIIAIGSRQIASVAGVTSVLATHRPGQSVPVAWTDQQGQSHTAAVTLAAGPAE
ncbi:MAG: S1C family serine protease [Actinomycetota bacterium]|nr:S1C family serine protease [Actinomycetota bacterium]